MILILRLIVIQHQSKSIGGDDGILFLIFSKGFKVWAANQGFQAPG